MGGVQHAGDSFSVRLKVKPRASREGIEGIGDGRLVVSVRAAPAGGAANDAVVNLLARAAGLSKSDFRIIRGAASRLKTVSVAGATAAEFCERLGIPRDPIVNS